MIFVILIGLGLCGGSFVNALVWRVHEQSKRRLANSDRQAASSRKQVKIKTLPAGQLSILNGRSICPKCYHQLSWYDLVPVFSWLWLTGKCRYCKQPISWQYPLVELVTALVFLLSYVYWPQPLNTQGTTLFIFWLVLVIGFMALVVYDLRWMLLPNKIIYPLIILALIQAVVLLLAANSPTYQLIDLLLSFLAGGGIFYVIFQISKGRWIGGGDVKLGVLLGLVLASPSLSLLMIFTASIVGTMVSLPLLISKKISRTSKIPFGPFLIVGAIIAQLFGTAIIAWYKRITLG